MKRRSGIHVPALAAMIIATFLFVPAGFAADVKLESYTIEKQSLQAPVNAPDMAGRKRQFNQVYVVKIKGQIPAYGAMPVQLFIGDSPIREYGGTDDGIYFKVYDVNQLRQWHGKPIRYAVKPNDVRDSGLTFHADTVPQ